MPRPVHFELPSADPARAIDFFAEVFGWRAEKVEGMDYWILITGPDDKPGINGGIYPPQNPAAKPSNVIGVGDLDATLAAVVAAGGTLAAPRMEIPNVGSYASFRDLDGHLHGLLQPVGDC